MLRIAVVTPLFPTEAEPYRGIFNYRTVRALQALAEVEVFCPRAAYPRWSVMEPRKFRFRRPDPRFSPAGVRVRYIEYPALPFFTRWVNSRMCARALRAPLAAARPDLILAYWVHPEGYGATMVGKQLGLPVVLGAMGSDLRCIPGQMARYQVKRALSCSSMVLTVSEDLRRCAIQLGAPADRVKTVLNGCDSFVFRPAERAAARAELGVSAESQLILFVGRLQPVKGITELLEAVARLASSHPFLELACIGEGTLATQLSARAAHRDLAGRVLFLNSQPPERIARWLAASNLLCLPSHSEGCPNVVLEALSCGRPVVASDVGGIPELVNETCGRLVPPRNVVLLADALAEAINRPWDEAVVARKFSRGWDRVAEETCQACLTVMEHNRRERAAPGG